MIKRDFYEYGFYYAKFKSLKHFENLCRNYRIDKKIKRINYDNLSVDELLLYQNIK